jgi:hypothetical protein
VSKRDAEKGSQKQLQRLVNDPTDPLGSCIAQAVKFETDEKIIWKSPLSSENYVEYHDKKFLEKLNLQPATMKFPLNDFWPNNGPYWDGLAQTNKGKRILVEAKSFTVELTSQCKATAPASIEKIYSTLAIVQEYFGCQIRNDWSKHYYQYANRLAHLFWLRELNHIDAHLVFIYFVNDSYLTKSKEREGPKTKDQWKAKSDDVYQYLSLERTSLLNSVHNVFIDVSLDQCI